MDGEFSLLAKTVIAGTLERVLDGILTQSPECRQILNVLSGKTIALRLRPLPDTLYLLPTPERIQVLTECSGAPDVTLTGTPLAFARLSVQGVGRPDLASGDLEIAGDVAVAEQLQRLAQAGGAHWERVWNEWAPPGLASGLSSLLRSVRDWGAGASLSLQQDVGEFLREEARDVPSPAETQDFLAGVDQLRDDCDRLEARVARLQSGLADDRPDRD